MKPKRFEIGIYNQEVANAMKAGTHHRHYKDAWAERNYFTVDAASVEDAKRKMVVKYPPEMGFVIDSINEIIE